MIPFYRSKTFWFSLLTIVTAVAALFGFQDFQLSGAEGFIVKVSRGAAEGDANAAEAFGFGGDGDHKWAPVAKSCRGSSFRPGGKGLCFGYAPVDP